MAITPSKYRETVRVAWLKEMGRTRLTSAEFAHIKNWHSEGVDVGLVLRAIERCVTRSRASGRTIWTIGVIQADINALRRQALHSWVGGHGENGSQDSEEWRKEWRDRLQELADSATNPELAAMYRELRVDMVALYRDEFESRLKEIR